MGHVYDKPNALICEKGDNRSRTVNRNHFQRKRRVKYLLYLVRFVPFLPHFCFSLLFSEFSPTGYRIFVMPGNILLNQVFVTYNLHQKSRKSDNRKFLKINRVRFFLVHFYPISAFGLLFPSFSPTGCRIFVIPVYMLLNQVFVPYNLHQKSRESDNRKSLKINRVRFLARNCSWREITVRTGTHREFLSINVIYFEQNKSKHFRCNFGKTVPKTAEKKNVKKKRRI